MKIKTTLVSLVGLGMSLGFMGCKKNEQAQPTQVQKGDLVVFAQANSQDPWRRAFDDQIKEDLPKYKNLFKFEEQDAEDDPVKQINVIETFLTKNPKVLLISPITEAVQPAVQKAVEQGVKVVMLDRKIGKDWTTWAGGDNREIGRKAGEFIASKLNDKGTVLMIEGTSGADATTDRKEGFLEIMKQKFPKIKVIQGDDSGYQRQKARSYMDTFLQSRRPFDAVYCHNDEMAIGAAMALEAAKVPKKIIVGVDGCQKEIMDFIKQGRVTATFVYPIPGKIGLELAAKIIKGEPVNKEYVLPTQAVDQSNVEQYVKDHPLAD